MLHTVFVEEPLTVGYPTGVDQAPEEGGLMFVSKTLPTWFPPSMYSLAKLASLAK